MAYVAVAGVALRTVLTNRGRIDMAVTFADKVYIIEFKCNQSAKAAIKQIREKGYAEKYSGSGKEMILMGINFSTEKRNLAEWQVEADARHPQVNSSSERSKV